MVSHICLLVELGPICNSMAASLCLKSCEVHSLLKSYNGGLWKNIYRSGPSKVVQTEQSRDLFQNKMAEHCLHRSEDCVIFSQFKQ